MGVAMALGEVTIIGFLKGFPHRLVGDFASGSEFSGTASSLLLLVLMHFNIPLNKILLIMTVALTAFLYTFWLL